MDLSGLYRKLFNRALGQATQVADPRHLVKLANQKLDETPGHRGRTDDPLYRGPAGPEDANAGHCPLHGLAVLPGNIERNEHARRKLQHQIESRTRYAGGDT
jgi:hypothetical protein